MSSHLKCLPHFLAQNKHVLLFKNTSDFSFQKHKISSHLKCLPHCLVQNRQCFLFQSKSNFFFQKHKNIILPKIPPTLFGSKQTMLSFFKEHTLFLCKNTKCSLTCNASHTFWFKTDSAFFLSQATFLSKYTKCLSPKMPPTLFGSKQTILSF